MAERNREGWTIPDVIDPPESMEVTICIPKNVVHMKAFWGALWELTFWNNWESDPEHQGALVADVWYRYWLSWQREMSELPDCEGGMSTCCVQPAIILRINPDTGVTEQSINGGTSWSPQAGGFPSVIVNPVPPVTSGVSATKCDAATNVSGQVQAWIDQVSNDFTTATTLLEFGQAVIVAIAGAVLVVLTGGALAPVEALALAALGAALTAAWGAGKAVFDAYWTTENKDKIFCAAVCAIGDDGSFTDDQFSEFWNKCNSELPASPAKMLFMGFLSSVGTSGLNAMAASGVSADSDCSDCDCTTCVERYEVKFGTEVSRTDSTITVEAAFNPGDSTYHAQIGTHDYGTGSHDDGCYITWSASPLTGAASVLNGQDTLQTTLGSWDNASWFLDYNGVSAFTKTFTISDSPLPAPS